MLEGDTDSQGESVPVGTVKLKSEIGQNACYSSFFVGQR